MDTKIECMIWINALQESTKLSFIGHEYCMSSVVTINSKYQFWLKVNFLKK